MTTQPKTECILMKKYKSLDDKKIIVQARSPKTAAQKISVRLGCECGKKIIFQETTKDSKKKIYTYGLVDNRMKPVEKPKLP